MRDIKFRLWIQEADKRTKFDQMYYSDKDYNTLEAFIREYETALIVDEAHLVVLMQYTGLKDKNDKEIYEGDVVIQYSRGNKEAQRGDVRWSTDETGYQIGDRSEWRLGIYTGMYSPNSLEVVGNIYENPELIENQI